MVVFLIAFPSIVFKRSVNTMPSYAKFAQFGGKHIEEVNIGNMDAVLAYEKRQ